MYEERNAPRLPVVTIVRADAPRLWAAALRLVDEYVASLEVDLDFQDFQRERANLACEYGPPSGALLLAREEELFLGCGAIRRHSDLAARGATPAAFDAHCIPPGGVAPRSNTGGIFARRAWPDGRFACLGAARDLHYGLPASAQRPAAVDTAAGFSR